MHLYFGFSYRNLNLNDTTELWTFTYQSIIFNSDTRLVTLCWLLAPYIPVPEVDHYEYTQIIFADFIHIMLFVMLTISFIYDSLFPFSTTGYDAIL